jgi:hypothetical protein
MGISQRCTLTQQSKCCVVYAGTHDCFGKATLQSGGLNKLTEHQFSSDSLSHKVNIPRSVSSEVLLHVLAALLLLLYNRSIAI